MSPDFDPVKLHRDNIRRLCPSDILVPSYPGSGAALFCNLVTALGHRYSDPYTEQLDANGMATPVEERRAYRQRISGLAPAMAGTEAPDALRFVKTHLYPREFDACTFLRVVLLVRDPRDAVHSYYHWRLGFSEEGESGTFGEFLSRPTFAGVPPAQDWASFNSDWIDWASRGGIPLHVLSFEAVKLGGYVALRAMFNRLGRACDDDSIAHALDASSFERMQAHERAITGTDDDANAPLIMRRGQVQEWREWYEGALITPFLDPHVVATARRFGYGDLAQ